MAENRVRIIIEVPTAQAVQGVAQVGAALDGLGGKAKGIDLGAALGVDASVIVRPVREVGTALDDLGTKARRAGEVAGTAMVSAGAETAKLARAGKAAADSIEAAWQKLGLRSGNAIRADIAETIAAYKRLASSGQASGRDLEAAMAATRTRVGDLRRELSRVNEFQGLKDQVKHVRQLSDEMGHLQSVARTAGAALASYFTVRELAELAKDIVNVGMQFDSLRNSLKTASGDSVTAANDFVFLRNEANRLGLELLSTGSAYSKFKAAARGTALEGAGTEKIFTAVAEAARALHLSSDQTSGALLALQQMMSKGTVQAEELRGQLGERIPGAFNLAAQAMGVTTSELGKMLEQGQVLAVDMLPKLADAMHKAYGSGAAEAASSAAAELERLKNTVAEYKDMVYSAFSEDLASAIRDTNSLLNENKESVNLYLYGVKGYAHGAAEEIKRVGNEAGISAGKIIDALKRVSAFGAALDVAQMISGRLQAKGQEGLQHQSNQKLLDELLNLAKNGQQPDLKPISKDAYNQLMGLSPSYDSTKLMSGVPLSSKSKLDKTWTEILPKISQVDKELASGKLQGSGLDQALQDRAKLYDGLTIAQQDYQKSLDKGSKAEANAAVAAERYGESASAFYDQTINSLAQLEDSLTGGAEKNANRVDKWFEQMFDSIRQKVVGAKGDVSKYAEAWVALESAWSGDKQLAVIKDTTEALNKQAQILQDIASATGDPAMAYDAQAKAAKAWYDEKKLLVESSFKDEAEKAGLLVSLQEGYNAKLLDAKVKAYADVSGVSSQYWQAEWELLGEHLKHVKDNCDSEYAYEVYAAKKRSELRKKEIETRLDYQKDFLSTLKDALSLEFGLYKDAATRQHDTWVSLSKDIASTVHGLSDTVAGGATDAFSAWITGSETMADAFKSAMDSMLDYLMTIIQKMIAYALENYIIIPIVESVVGADSSASLTGSGSGSGSDSLTSSAMSKITSKATDYGISKGMSYVGDLFSSSTSLASLSAASATEMGALASTGAGAATTAAMTGTTAGGLGGYTAVTSGAASGGALAGTSSAAAGLGTVLGVVGGVAALGGLLAMGLSTTKTETKTGSGIRVAIIGDSTNVTGTDYYKVTESSMLGGSSTSHEIRSTGAADAETTNAVNDALGTYTTAIKAGFKELGVETADSLANFYFPEWDVAPGQEEDYYRNVSNAKVGKILADAGLTDAFAAIAKEGEPWIDQLSRLYGSLATVKTATEQMGLSLESLAGEDYIAGLVDKMLTAGDSAGTAGMDFDALAGVLDDETLASLKDMQAQAAATGEEVQATNEQLRQLALAQYASELVDAFGSTDAVSSAFNRYYANAYSSTEQATRLMQYYAKGAGEALGALGTSGVTLENFWSAYRAAMENSAMSADQLKAWDDAAQWVEAWDTSLKTAGQAWDSTNQTLIDGINDQIAALEKQRDAIQETLDLWSDFLASIKDLRQAIKWDSDLTDLSPYEQYQQKKAAFDETAAKAKAGDKDAMAELPDLTQAYLDASRDYYASSENYFADFEHADATLASLEQFAQVQVDQAQAQLDAINNEIAILTLQVDQLTLVNANLASLGSAWGDGVSAIVSAINDSSFSSAYADSMAAANAAQAAAAASLLATMSGGASSAAAAEASGFDWSSLFAGNDLYTGSGVEEDEDGTVRFVGMADGGLVTGGVPGLDSVPTMLMPGERVFSVAHSRIIERLATSGQSSATDTSGIERRLDRVAATSALASRANQEALEGLRRELSVVANKLSRDARRPQGRAR
ncbi:tape measure protein [Solidesulfovibrio sp.]